MDEHKGRSDSQALNNTQSAEAKVLSKHWEEFVEESGGPTDFGEEEDYNLCDDQKAIEDGPEHAGGLVWNGRVASVRSCKQGGALTVEGDIRDVIMIGGRRIGRRRRVQATGIILIGAESLDVVGECHDAA